MLNLNGHTKDYIIYNYEQKNLIKNEKNPRFMREINFFFSLSISPWENFATWLHLEVTQENTKRVNKNLLQTLN